MSREFARSRSPIRSQWDASYGSMSGRSGHVYRIIVKNLPYDVKWSVVKDLFRKEGKHRTSNDAIFINLIYILHVLFDVYDYHVSLNVFLLILSISNLLSFIAFRQSYNFIVSSLTVV